MASREVWDDLGAAKTSALARLKDRATTRRAHAGPRGGVPPPNSAAASHAKNDAYMTNFAEGMRALGLDDAGVAPEEPPEIKRPTQRKTWTIPAHDDKPAPRAQRSGAAAAPGRFDAARWLKGPLDAAGTEVDLSDRPIMCGSTAGDRVVLGCSDHALYEVDAITGRRTRALYTKRYGHAEWVTCVSHCPDGRVVSGGMDSKLCVWDARGVKCTDLLGHAGSVSDVKVPPSGAVAVSSSYDKTVRVWPLSVRGMRDGTGAVLKAHRAPVLTLDVRDDVAASGSRDGELVAYDLAASAPLDRASAHGGHVTAVAFRQHSGASDDAAELFTGGQDGFVRAWDLRAGLASPVGQAGAHRASDGGSGAVGLFAQAPTRNLLVSGGADGAANVFDTRQLSSPVATLRSHADFLYSITVVADRVLATGDGRGEVHFADLAAAADDAPPAYALGAGRNAVRYMGATASSDALVCAGDDGNALVYRYAIG